MAPNTRHDPLANCRFRVEVDGLQASGFSEISFGPCGTEVIEYREGNDVAVRKLPGLTRYGNVILKRGITSSLELYQWHRQVVDGQIGNARRNVVITLMDETRSDVARFLLHNAWPTKYEVGTLDASGNDVAIESLELTHEGLERAA
jgi:phage tail-like protein